MSASDLPKRVAEFIEREELFVATDRLLLAVSGGLDSTVMVHVLHELGYAIGLAHCNYQLRGAASEDDERAVRTLANSLSVPVHIKRTTIGEARFSEESMQMTARRIRYQYFKKILDEYKYVAVSVAHHLDDAFETSLLNLIRGTGLRGLAGIAPRRDRIVRPLLCCTRKELHAYALLRGLEWREDSSNASDHYLRNRVRHHLAPVFVELGMAQSTLRRTLDRLRTENELLEMGYRSLEAAAVSRQGTRLTIDRRQLPTRFAQRLLERLAGPYGFTPEQCRQMLSLAERRSLHSSVGIVEVDSAELRFDYGSPTYPEETGAEINHLPYIHETASRDYALSITARPNRLAETCCQYLRLTDLPLRLRHRRAGDRMQPLGMGGKSRSLKKLYNDLKLSKQERSTTLLLCDRQDRVMAILGYRVSEAYRVREQDDRVIRIKQTPKNPELP